MLGLDYFCYTDPQERDFPKCESSGTTILTTRGRTFDYYPDGFSADDSFQNYSEAVPYKIDPEWRWRVGTSLASPRNPFNVLFSSSSPIEAVANQWLALETAPDYATAMSIADSMAGAIVNGTYKSTPLSKVTVWQVAVEEGITAEELKLFLDGETPATADLLHVSIESTLIPAIYEVALNKIPIKGTTDLVTPVARFDGVLRRIGMDSIVVGLLNSATNAGVKLFYNQRVVQVSRVKNGTGEMNVMLENGQLVRTGTVFLNIPRNELIALGLVSEPVKSSEMDFRGVLSRVNEISFSKMYCFWEDAWWLTKLNLTKGIFRTADETLFSGRYHDGDVTCAADSTNFTTCRGGLLVSYIGGGTVGFDQSLSIRAHNSQIYSPWTMEDNVRTLIPSADMDPHDKLFFDEIQRQLRKAHAETFENFGLDVETDLPDAEGCVYADWLDIGMHTEHGPRSPDVNPLEIYTKPVKDLNISLVNEAWSDVAGWAEGSLRSAERALYHTHGLDKPAWLDTIFHDSVIKKFGRG